MRCVFFCLTDENKPFLMKSCRLLKRIWKLSVDTLRPRLFITCVLTLDSCWAAPLSTHTFFIHSVCTNSSSFLNKSSLISLQPSMNLTLSYHPPSSYLWHLVVTSIDGENKVNMHCCYYYYCYYYYCCCCCCCCCCMKNSRLFLKSSAKVEH